MKKHVFIFAAFVILVWLSCKSHKEITFSFPAEMPEYVKKDNEARCKEGYRLYAKNCAMCHSQFKRKKEIIPQFTVGQISTYQFRLANNMHSDSLREERVSDEELTYIITFLTYYKRR